NGQVIVAEMDGGIAGFAAVVGGELDGLFVEPDLWGRGIGRALVDAATRRGSAGLRSASSPIQASGDSTRVADFPSREKRRRASVPRSG
ncbi:MAG: GNAT family N-acetyltransferase, partial [Sphingomicrobium sp.]